MGQVQKLNFEDLGQDFTEWYVRDGIVIDCQPFQGFVWVGSKVLQGSGKLLVLVRGSDEFMALKHSVASRELLTEEQSSEVEKIGRKWASMINIPAAQIGL